MGRPLGVPNKDKPVRDAIRMEAIALANGEVIKHPPGSLRASAQAQLLKASEGDTPAFNMIADRLDGKPAQSHEHSGADGGPIELESTDTRAMARAVMALFREANLDSPP